MVRKSILLIAVFLGSLNLSMSADEAMDSLRFQRDEILQRAENEGWSDRQLSGVLWPVVREMLAKTQGAFRKKMRDDNEHFANRIYATEALKAKVVEIMQSNKFYSGYNPDDVAVLDGTGFGVPAELREVASCGMAISRNPQQSPFIRQRFPKAKALILFNPYTCSTQDQMEASIGHELAHMTQLWLRPSINDPALLYYSEIEADIRNICTQKETGIWTLRENSAQLIDDCCAHMYEITSIEEVKRQSVIGLEDSQKTKMEFVWNCITTVADQMPDPHPAPKVREAYMREVAALIKRLGGSISNDEMNAMIAIIATRVCMDKGFGITDEFVQLTGLKKACTSPRIVEHIQLPASPAACGER